MHASWTQQLPNIAALCERYGVAHLELFGSATGTELNPDRLDCRQAQRAVSPPSTVKWMPVT